MPPLRKQLKPLRKRWWDDQRLNMIRKATSDLQTIAKQIESNFGAYLAGTLYPEAFEDIRDAVKRFEDFVRT